MIFRGRVVGTFFTIQRQGVANIITIQSNPTTPTESDLLMELIKSWKEFRSLSQEQLIWHRGTGVEFLTYSSYILLHNPHWQLHICIVRTGFISSMPSFTNDSSQWVIYDINLVIIKLRSVAEGFDVGFDKKEGNVKSEYLLQTMEIWSMVLYWKRESL